MSDVTITIFDNGPIEVAGPVTLLDENGNPIPHEEEDSIFLCRCGHSSEKPFCDGTHDTCGFSSKLTS
jgi:CDGSH-type Zn-finger protein